MKSWMNEWINQSAFQYYNILGICGNNTLFCIFFPILICVSLTADLIFLCIIPIWNGLKSLLATVHIDCWYWWRLCFFFIILFMLSAETHNEKRIWYLHIYVVHIFCNKSPILSNKKELCLYAIFNNEKRTYKYSLDCDHCKKKNKLKNQSGISCTRQWAECTF